MTESTLKNKSIRKDFFSFNHTLMAAVGSVGVSYHSIAMYICYMFNMVLIGLAHGAQPIMSYSNLGWRLFYFYKHMC